MGTSGCRSRACVYDRLEDGKCFAENIKAAIHGDVPGIMYDRVRTPEQGKRLKESLLETLAHWPGPKDNDDKDHKYDDKSIIVCPEMVSDGKFSTGTYIVQALQEFFDVRETTGNRIHLFVVYHLYDKQELWVDR